jgi:4-hydroxyphenylpyruvate dioxygenase-like putative hemolysin
MPKPPICYQLGFITDCSKKLIPQLQRAYGVPEFFHFPDIQFKEVIYRGRKVDCRVSVAIGYSGTVQIEVVEPISGEGAYTEFLESGGNGMHHIGLLVDDFDQALEAQISAGLPVIQTGIIGQEQAIRFAYIDTVPTLGVITEIIWLSDAMKKLYQRIHERSLRQADKREQP